ncbi:hypothetical protein SAMN06298216_4516 [Spirosomataceae bacterium TFI 002]|nr:hypothetical protein SAMN06298216_4516 [Spirosomataceae bacterium TFI 002]
MKNRSSVFFGALLVAFGFFLLAFNYDLINFSFRQIARFWPALLLIGGLAVIVHPKKAFFNTVTALCIAFTIPLAIYSSASDGIDRVTDKIDNDFHFDYDTEDSDDFDFGDSDENVKKSDGNIIEQDYSLPMNSAVERAKLDFGGGAAEFHLSETTDNIFEAKTSLTAGTYRLSDQIKGNLHDIEFNMKSKNQNNRFKINEDFDLQNDVYLKLNTKPIWDIDIKLGAGDLNFDLSKYKIEELDIETGAASVDLKLGANQDEMKIDVSSGVASIRLNIPEPVGCRIKMNGIFNSKDFEGFTKEGEYYVTSNYKSASKKIEVKMSSAMSSLEIDRY